MPRERLAGFEVERLQILDEQGRVDEKLEPRIPAADLKKMYYFMHLSRAWDKKALAMQRQGRLATFAPVYGQEASEVASAYALGKNDWVVPSFRESAVFLTRGAGPLDLFLYTKGSEDAHRALKGTRVLPVSIPVGSQIPHAAGLAWAAKMRGEKSAALVYFGDGATSEGDFHEALNFAGVFRLPAIFFCQNNQWAISTPRARQTASETIAQKAIAYGVSGLQVDGNDVLAVYAATKEALARAHQGEGATLIESVTYRLWMHTTADDPKKYRSEEEVEQWAKKDPLPRFRRYLEQKGLWSEDEEKALAEQVTSEVEKAAQELEQLPPPDPRDMFRYVFAEMPQNLKEQQAYLEPFLKEEA